MDIKIEPEDESLSTYASENAYNCDSRPNNVYAIWAEEQSIDIKVETPEKQEEIVDETDHRETNKIIFETSNTDSEDPFKPQPMTLFQNDSSLTPDLNLLQIKKERLPQEVDVVIMLENCVFYEQYFVCSVCFNTFPSARLLQQHLTLHGKANFHLETRVKLEGDLSIEPDNDSVTSYSADNSCCINMNEEQSIDIKHEPLANHEGTFNQDQHGSQKFQNTNLSCPVTSDPNSKSFSRNRLASTRFINEQSFEGEILKREV